MSSNTGKWREEQVLILCPGSQTTMAQLGVAELTLPSHRIPTRMFKDPDTNDFVPFRIYKRKKDAAQSAAQTDAPSGAAASTTKSGGDDDEWEYVEDRDSVEGAIYPIISSKIVNMPAFLAFLEHVHNLLTTTYHNTPIVLMVSPSWSRGQIEIVTRYIFEKTKTPSLCLMNSACATQYGTKHPNMTVVDIGYEKVDVTCLHEYYIVNHGSCGYNPSLREISGGEVFTQLLYSLLKDKGFTYDMAEQLKRSPICEVLPFMPAKEHGMDLPTDNTGNSTRAEASHSSEPTKPAFAADADVSNGDNKDTDEGVLDVANIVTSGNTREFLAKREKEKAEKAKAKAKGKGQDAEAEKAKAQRVPNSQRKTNIFHYEDLEHEDVEISVSNGTAPAAAPTNGEAPATDGAAKAGDKPEAEPTATDGTTGPPSSDSGPTATERRTKRVRKDIEVGLERFLFAERLQIDRIVECIYRTIQQIPEMGMRPHCWECIAIVGNGSRIKGLKENIMETLERRFKISPSSATMFVSELPSNMATPSGTGSQTPTGSFTGQLPTSSSVNPLLQAATTASLGVPGHAQASGSQAGGSSHHHHGQTPLQIKSVAWPNYLAEWNKSGFEEAMFLGCCIAGRLVYCNHHADPRLAEDYRMSQYSRLDYNALGPRGIHHRSMLAGGT
ncbi:actin-like ATPase domain-containing protein [Xylariaceae sp. FL1272]|nr:actin-like ATPase domain-containing protein [Xylariaceae sp. FL1272]